MVVTILGTFTCFWFIVDCTSQTTFLRVVSFPQEFTKRHKTWRAVTCANTVSTFPNRSEQSSSSFATASRPREEGRNTGPTASAFWACTKRTMDCALKGVNNKLQRTHLCCRWQSEKKREELDVCRVAFYEDDWLGTPRGWWVLRVPSCCELHRVASYWIANT